ncbi:MAG: anthranilate phosphoribosyltransferase, partial [Spirochaetae bacterium HGW-Spirochaetae-6]
MILLIDNYDSFVYNIYQYFCELGAQVTVKRNDEITLAEITALNPDYIVISPGPCTPNEAGISLSVIREFAGKKPILGVCLGHQAIGQVFGGKVIQAEVIKHGKTSPVVHQGQGIFQGIPSPLTATRYHSLIVEKKSLPAELLITAESEDGYIMGLRHKEYPIEGLQFHPESILTEYGKKLLLNFLENYKSVKTLEKQESPMKNYIDRVVMGKDLSEAEMQDAITVVMEGKATDSQIAAFLTALRLKGETIAEITGAVRVMREKALKLERPKGSFLVDTCGTGGDKTHSFNISTAAAFVAAGAGVLIAKHGNRAVSSKSGSADVLSALGVNLDISPETASRCLAETGIVFMFAPKHHLSMKHAVGPRQEIGIRTIFNI